VGRGAAERLQRDRVIGAHGESVGITTLRQPGPKGTDDLGAPEVEEQSNAAADVLHGVVERHQGRVVGAQLGDGQAGDAVARGKGKIVADEQAVAVTATDIELDHGDAEIEAAIEAGTVGSPAGTMPSQATVSDEAHRHYLAHGGGPVPSMP
jgi:hypothetical protein